MLNSQLLNHVLVSLGSWFLLQAHAFHSCSQKQEIDGYAQVSDYSPLLNIYIDLVLLIKTSVAPAPLPCFNRFLEEVNMQGDPGGVTPARSTPLAAPGPSVYYMCAVSEIHRVFGSFTGQKASLIREIGFGGLLKTPNVVGLDMNLTVWLMSKLDTNTMRLSSVGRRTISVTGEDVHLVLGIPSGEPVQHHYNVPESDVARIRELLYLSEEDGSLTLTYLEMLLMADCGEYMNKKQQDAFKVATVLYVFAYYLGCVTDRFTIPLWIVSNLLDPSCIVHKNWSAYVLKSLDLAPSSDGGTLQRGKHYHNTWLLTIPAVFYLDNLDFRCLSLKHDAFPRVSFYHKWYLDLLVSQDRIHTSDPGVVRFGRTEHYQMPRFATVGSLDSKLTGLMSRTDCPVSKPHSVWAKRRGK
ncbi:hypothetical protein ACP4OV_031872 [Aristida adscensionis]